MTIQNAASRATIPIGLRPVIVRLIGSRFEIYRSQSFQSVCDSHALTSLGLSHQGTSTLATVFPFFSIQLPDTYEVKPSHSLVLITFPPPVPGFPIPSL